MVNERYKLIYQDNFDNDKCKKCSTEGVTFNNHEATISPTDLLVFNGVDLDKYRYFVVESEIYFDSDQYINIGFYGNGTYYTFLGAGNACVYTTDSKSIKDLGMNPYKGTNTWKKIKYQRFDNSTEVRINENVFDYPSGYKYTYFHFHKHLASGYLKVRNFKIYAFLPCTCRGKSNDRSSFRLGLMIMLLSI